MKKTVLLLLIATFMVSCQTPEPPSKITNDEVMNTFNDFFDKLDNDLNQLENLVTDDFYIFENSRKYTKDQFIEFVKSFDIVSSKRDFKDVRIQTDYHSAHITLRQLGEFLVKTDEGLVQMNFDWLESAYLIKENDSLKFSFYFSEAVGNTTNNIE